MSPEDQHYGQPNPAGRPQRRPDHSNGVFGQPNQQYNPNRPYQQEQYDPNRQYQQGQRGQQYGGPNQQYDSNQQYGPNQQYGLNQQYQPNRQYDPNQQYDPYGWQEDGDPPGPGRGKLIGVFVGLAILALLVGVGAARFLGGSNSTNTTTTLQPAATPTAAAQPSIAATTAAAQVDDTPTATPTPSATRTPNYRSIPEDATTEKGLDFGFLTKVTNANGIVTLRFDRANFYTGAEAIQHNKGVPPPDDYLIENTNPTLRTFELDPSASIIAASRLASDPSVPGRQALTIGEFVQNSQTALSSSTVGVPVWLRHTNGLTGPVTALAEQYLP